MKKFNKKMSLKDFAFAVAEILKSKNIDVVLTGGAVVSIYSEGKPVVLSKIKKWSIAEGMKDKYDIFLEKLAERNK